MRSGSESDVEFVCAAATATKRDRATVMNCMIIRKPEVFAERERLRVDLVCDGCLSD